MILETRHEFISIGADGVQRQVRVPIAQIAKPGGEGELLLDFVSDYVVRCKGCGRSTRAEGFAIRAIGDWNHGETPCDCSGIGDL